MIDRTSTDGISHTRTWRDFARAPDTRSLDPSDKINRYLVEQRKMGAVPRVIAVNADERWSSIEMPSLSATLRLPFGWHALDDGRRTLVFDPQGGTQFNFTLVPAEGRTVDQLVEETKEQAIAGQPGRPTLVETLGEMKLLAVADLSVEGEVLDVCWLYTLAPVADDQYLQVRVAAAKQQMTDAMDLFELLMTEFVFLVQRASD